MASNNDSTRKPRPDDRYVELKVAHFPPGYKDAAELLSSDGGEAMWERMIIEAVPIKAWAIDHLDDHHDLTTTKGAVDACADMIDYLLVEPPVARARYVQQLAEKLDLPELEVRQTLDQVLAERGDYYREHPEDRPDIGMDIPSL